MLARLRALFRPPRPAGPPQRMRAFQPPDQPLTRDGVTPEGDGWLIEAGGARTVRLFEIADPDVESCLLAYRAQLRAERLDGRAYLEMWCRFPGRGEFFSKGFHAAVNGTTGWSSAETPFYLKRGQRPDLIRLNVVVEGSGVLRLKDVELLRTPLA
jgi:hypothetical protein